MNEKFEYHVNELKKLSKKLFTYGLYVAIFFLGLFIIFFLIGFYETSRGTLFFMAILSLLFFTEFIYGLRLFLKFQWILNNYQTEKEKCLELLTMHNVNMKNVYGDLEKDDLPFSVRYNIHSKLAYDILKEL